MGKTFGVSIRVLGAIAVIQLVVVLWAVLMRFDGEVRASIAPVEVFRPSVASPPAPALPPAIPGPAAPPAPVFDPAQTFQPLPIPGPNLFPAPAPNAPNAPYHLRNDTATAAVAEALALREKGDTQGALEALNLADAQEPNHPKILSELATTYGQMGLQKRETETWTKIHELGLETAGPYWDLADMFFKGQEAEPDLTSVLRIKGHTAVSDEQPPDGSQRVMLKVFLEATSAEPVDATQLVLRVFFFDLVNGESFKPTIADTIEHVDVTAPYDWKHGAERIDVEYFLPKLTDEQVANHGQRQYYGYVVELYYADVLQDFVANPRKLGRLGSSTPSSYSGSGLFPDSLKPEASPNP